MKVIFRNHHLMTNDAFLRHKIDFALELIEGYKRELVQKFF